MEKTLEIIVFNAEDAIRAESNGATQLELVNNLSEDGLTPSEKIIRSVVEAVSIPVHVMVRPSNRFIHNESEIAAIEKSICFCRDVGAAGVVYGSLTKSGTIDEPKLERVLHAAGEMRTVFHRAVDFTNDYIAAQKTLAGYPIYSTLTSGGAESAVQGITGIQQAIALKLPHKLLIGSGVSIETMPQLMAAGVRAFHVGTAARFNNSPTSAVDPQRVKSLWNYLNTH